MTDFPAEPTYEEVGAAVCQRIEEYLYSEKDTRHPWYAVDSSVMHYTLCVFITYGLPESPVKGLQRYELVNLTDFVWTTP
jgi:hypothetical protein